MPRQVRADVAGTVWKVTTAVGATVSPGDTVVILESMKVEIPVRAQAGGRVTRVLVAEGDAVEEDSVLVEIT
ncbi:MAG: biotin/lipoyl-binding carrier protein [Deltaproteobacteria bacterium]|nr:biotin/lipoyl-binding carrier protein [Deltaproteobacteria bacterium]